MKLDKKQLKKLILETLNETERGHLKSLPGGGEGSGIASGQLSDVKQAMNEIEIMIDKFQSLKDSMEQIYQRELARKNNPLPFPQSKETDIPD